MAVLCFREFVSDTNEAMYADIPNNTRAFTE